MHCRGGGRAGILHGDDDPHQAVAFGHQSLGVNVDVGTNINITVHTHINDNAKVSADNVI